MTNDDLRKLEDGSVSMLDFENSKSTARLDALSEKKKSDKPKTKFSFGNFKFYFSKKIVKKKDFK